MEANFSIYNYLDSIDRITEILNSSDSGYTSAEGIPSRSSLTFTNGFYVDVTVLFVDIRGSKALATAHTRPVLAKIYRAYISEMVAVLKSNATINEIYIEGDGVWAVFDTRTKPQVNSVFETAAMISSLVDIMNIKLKKKGYSSIDVGIGLDDGESLYIKAGYKGSGINEVVWIGKVVGSCANLCAHGNKTWSDKELKVSTTVYGNLTDHNKSLLTWDPINSCYEGYIINPSMNEWVKSNG